MDYIRRLKPKKVVLVHGDPAAVAWFHESVKSALPETDVVLPVPGVPVEI
jgi:predicted metal-dependent RNase